MIILKWRSTPHKVGQPLTTRHGLKEKEQEVQGPHAFASGTFFKNGSLNYLLKIFNFIQWMFLLMPNPAPYIKVYQGNKWNIHWLHY